jgi:hypothetical protein
MWKRAAGMVCLHNAVKYRKCMGRTDMNGRRSQFFHLGPHSQLDETLLYLCILLNILFLKDLTDMVSIGDDTIIKCKFWKGEYTV